MKKSFKLMFVLVVLCLGLANNVSAQKVYDKTTAVVNYNNDKMGTGAISYNTSFIIYHTNIEVTQLQQKEDLIKSSINGLIAFKLIAVDNNTGVYVEINLNATNKQDLTEKLKKIFVEFSVEEVESNEVTSKILDFKF